MARVDTTIDRSSGRSISTASVRTGLLVYLFGAAQGLFAQDSTALRIYGYAEVYYGYDLSRPPNNERPPFLYNHKRHNEFNANLALIGASYERDGVRGAMGLMAGTYVQYNLAHEPDLLRNIYEARVGMRLSKKREWWVDAGIFPAHIGFEGVIGMENMTLTRSMVAENSPYYEAGAMLSYGPNTRWLFRGLLLNGWQTIQREPGNARMAYGTQVQHTPDEFTVLNWSTFVGSMGPDSAAAWRFYNNLYGTFKGTNGGATLGIDMGLQEGPSSTTGSDGINGWFAAVAVMDQRISGRWWGTGRIEYFLDDQGLVIQEGALLGASLGVDHRIGTRASWRFEGRLLGSNEVFIGSWNGSPSQTNLALTTALCLRY